MFLSFVNFILERHEEFLLFDLNSEANIERNHLRKVTKVDFVLHFATRISHVQCSSNSILD